MELISVIVPVYNTEAYLDACVRSIAEQTYTNLEIILVDDGSTDRSPALCDAWAARDPRVRVIHQENGGLSAARNAGMQAIHGDYVGFIDSDDRVSTAMFERLHDLLLTHSADLAQCRMFRFSDPQNVSFPDCPAVKISVYSALDALRSVLTEGDVGVTCCNFLVKGSLARSVRFDVGRINEDVLWTFRVISKSQAVVTTNEAFYAYFQREGSIMNSSYSEKRFDAMYALSQRAVEIKQTFPDLYPFAARAYAGGCMYHYQTLCRLPDSEESRGFRKRLHAMFCAADLPAVYAVTGVKYRLWYTGFRLLPGITCRLRNLLRIGL